MSQALESLAIDLAVRAGTTITEMRADAVGSAETKSSPTDPVTAADRAAEDIIVEGIRTARPDDGIVGEEGTDHEGTSGVRWFVDPIDGTANYVYGIPAYSVSIGAEVNGRMEVGVVLNPVTDELFRARRGHGAHLGDTPISASTETDLEACMLGTGFGYLEARRRRQAEILIDVLPRVRDIRRFGSAALDLCAVAAGRLDAYYEAGLNSWDYAAGWLIATEAGAVVGNIRDGAPSSTFLLAAAPGLNDRLVELLRSADADNLPV